MLTARIVQLSRLEEELKERAKTRKGSIRGHQSSKKTESRYSELKSLLKESNGIRCLLTKWRTFGSNNSPSHCSLTHGSKCHGHEALVFVFSNGIIAWLFLSPSLEDIVYIYLDKYLIGKISTDGICDCVWNDSLFFSYTDGRILGVLFPMMGECSTGRHGQSGSGSGHNSQRIKASARCKSFKMKSMEGIRMIEAKALSGPSKRIPRHLVLPDSDSSGWTFPNSSLLTLWWQSNPSEGGRSINPWSPIHPGKESSNAGKESSNLLVFSYADGVRLQLVSFGSIHSQIMRVMFSKGRSNEVMVVSVGRSPLTLDYSVLEIPETGEDIQLVTVFNIHIPLVSPCLDVAFTAAQDKIIILCERSKWNKRDGKRTVPVKPRREGSNRAIGASSSRAIGGSSNRAIGASSNRAIGGSGESSHSSNVLLFNLNENSLYSLLTPFEGSFILCNRLDSLFVVSDPCGVIHFFDYSFNSIPVTCDSVSASIPVTCDSVSTSHSSLDILVHFDFIHKDILALRFTGSGSDSEEDFDLKLIQFFPRNLDMKTLIRTYLLNGRIDDAIMNLGTINWNFDPFLAYFCTNMIFNHLIKCEYNQTTCTSIEGQIEATLGAFFKPNYTIDLSIEREYKLGMHFLARRFFCHLIRFQTRQGLFKAFMLASDLKNKHLLRQLAMVAREKMVAKESSEATVAKESSEAIVAEESSEAMVAEESSESDIIDSCQKMILAIERKQLIRRQKSISSSSQPPMSSQCSSVAEPPVSNHQPLVSNHQPPVSNHQPPVSNHQPLVSNHQPPVSNHQPPVSNHQPPVSNHQPPVSNHQPPVSNQQPPVSNRLPAMSNNQLVSHRQSMESDQPPMGSDQLTGLPPLSPRHSDSTDAAPSRRRPVPAPRKAIIESAPTSVCMNPDPPPPLPSTALPLPSTAPPLPSTAPPEMMVSGRSSYHDTNSGHRSNFRTQQMYDSTAFVSCPVSQSIKESNPGIPFSVAAVIHDHGHSNSGHGHSNSGHGHPNSGHGESITNHGQGIPGHASIKPTLPPRKPNHTHRHSLPPKPVTFWTQAPPLPPKGSKISVHSFAMNNVPMLKQSPPKKFVSPSLGPPNSPVSPSLGSETTYPHSLKVSNVSSAFNTHPSVHSLQLSSVVQKSLYQSNSVQSHSTGQSPEISRSSQGQSPEVSRSSQGQSPEISRGTLEESCILSNQFMSSTSFSESPPTGCNRNGSATEVSKLEVSKIVSERKQPKHRIECINLGMV